MSSGEVTDVLRQMLVVCLQVAGPILIVSIAVGLIVAIFQAATQIHEQTLTFVPKLLIIALALLVMSSWIETSISDFSYHIFDIMRAL